MNSAAPIVPLEAARVSFPSVEPDNWAAVAFLRLYNPDGPWVLTAIQTDRKAIATRTFHPKDESDLLKWLSDFNGKRNIYFQVNPPLLDLAKKAKREAIKEVTWLHVDIDPRAGEDLEAERARALGLLTTNLPEGVPPPTCVIFSGGGYQGFWKLATPIPIDGELEKAEDAKRYNQQLEFLLGADNCHNIDRIMRLPGTINIPDAKKLKKGRTEALATLIEFDAERVYPVNQFIPAPKVQAQDAGIHGDAVSVPENVDRLASVEALDQWSVSDRVKVIIVQGKHPDEKKSDNSRSSWVFDVCCNLVRCEVPDAVIFSILTDPSFCISQSVREKGSSARRYALRQIQRAKEHAIDPNLAELNARHAVIGNYGGGCRVMTDDGRPEFQRFVDFSNQYMNRSVKVGENKNGAPITMPLGKWWLAHPKRRQYERVEFAPSADVPPGVFNLWRGFAVQPEAGTCDAFLNFIRETIAAGDDTLAEWLLNWMAHAVQRPHEPGEVAVVLRGGQGIGKSFFAEHFGQLFGPHFVPVTDPRHIVGNFNAILLSSLLIFADEAFAANDKRAEGILKGLVTQTHLTVEPKGVDPFKVKKFLRLIMASNHSWVVPADTDDRRFLVLDVSTSRRNDQQHFAKIEAEWENGGREALMAHLLGRDLSAFNHRRRPETAALTDQKVHSFRGAQRVIYEMLSNGDAPAIRTERGAVFVPTRAVFDLAGQRVSQQAIGHELRRVSTGESCRQTDNAGQQQRGFWLPPLQIARERWATAIRVAVPWPTDDGEWTAVRIEEPF